jgi:hypothetical protein
MTGEMANIANGRIKRNTNDYDNDLNPLLEKASNGQLQPLVEIITGTFSNWLDTDETYKKHKPNHVMYADLIASELRSFGGNSFANFGRMIAQNCKRHCQSDIKARIEPPGECAVGKISCGIDWAGGLGSYRFMGHY